MALRLLLAATLLSASIPAHVALDAPNGGVVLTPGTIYVIRWHVVIQHNTTGWDLHYSTTNGAGAWIPIATGLPVGDPSSGAMHTFYWTVPNDASSQVLVRVTQVNLGNSYIGVSPLANDIIAIPVSASPASISETIGGAHVIAAQFPSALAGSPYIVAGSLSGVMTTSYPFLQSSILNGFALPIIPDWYMDWTRTSLSPALIGFQGLLDATGAATATLAIPPNLPTSMIGFAGHHACGVVGSGTLIAVGNAAPLTIIP